MKKAVLLTSSLLFAATMTIAQNSPTAGSQDPTQNPSTITTQSQTSQGTTLRGCLSGSDDNFTLTDLNGTQYKLMGGDSSLEGAVGHEVEVSGTQSQSSETSSGNGETMAHAANTFQVSQVKDTEGACKMSSHSNAANPDDHPMDEKAPKGAATTTEPRQPQLMAMAQQTTNSPMSNTGTDASQTNESTSPTAPTSNQSTGGQATPPVTNQTPATSASPTSPDAQSKTTPANATGSPAETNSAAPVAPQGDTVTNPNTGQTSGQGVSEAPPASTDPNAVPSSPNSAAPQAPSSTPQASPSQPQGTDDSNKPLYERQATDVPYAHHDNSNSAATPH